VSGLRQGRGGGEGRRRGGGVVVVVVVVNDAPDPIHVRRHARVHVWRVNVGAALDVAKWHDAGHLAVTHEGRPAVSETRRLAVGDWGADLVAPLYDERVKGEEPDVAPDGPVPGARPYGHHVHVDPVELHAGRVGVW